MLATHPLVEWRAGPRGPSSDLFAYPEYERQDRHQPLSFLEEASLTDAPGEVRLLVDALGRRQEREWLACPRDGDVEAEARRPPGWARSVAARMQEAGLGPLVRNDAGGGMGLTGKGRLAAQGLAFA